MPTSKNRNETPEPMAFSPNGGKATDLVDAAKGRPFSGVEKITDPRRRRRLQREGSFTLIETVIALGIMTFIILEVSSVQGNAIVFSDYGRNVTQASWLARRVLSQVEYYWETKEFTELETSVTEAPFEDFPEYSYTLSIAPWKFPFVQLLTGGLNGGGEKEDAEAESVSDGGLGQIMQTVVDQVFGDEPIFMVAKVDVSWAEGAQRNSTGLTYLLTNQRKIDAAVAQLKPVYDRWEKQQQAHSQPPGGTPPPPGGTPPPPEDEPEP